MKKNTKLMRSTNLQYPLSIIVLFTFIIGLSACSSIQERGDKPSPDWSRSLPLGDDVAGSIGLSVDRSGERVHVIWSYNDGDKKRIRYVQLNDSGEQVNLMGIETEGQLKYPRVLSGGGNVHLVWAAREPGETNWRLQHALQKNDGQQVSESGPLSSGDIKVGKYTLDSDQNGGALIVWDQGDPGDLFYVHVGPAGEILNGPASTGFSGENPSISIGQDGVAHLAWLDDRTFYYAQLDPKDPGKYQATGVVDLDASGTLGITGDTMRGPILGYADGWVYIVWSILSLSDVEVGTASTEFVAFQADAPEQVMPTRLWMLAVEEQPYTAYSGSFSLEALGLPVKFGQAAEEYGQIFTHHSDSFDDWEDVSGAVSDYLMNPGAMKGEAGELAVALASSQNYRLESLLQIATVVFSDGKYRGYSVATKTRSISDNPVIAVDEQGELYVAWREGAGGRQVYYASSNPDTKDALDKLIGDDIYSFLLRAGTEGLVSVAFLPIVGFFWILPGILLLVVWKMYRDYLVIGDPTSTLALVIAVLLYFAVKIITLPTLLTYVPFSAWLGIPSQFHILLRISVPILVFVTAMLVANYVRKRYENSVLSFYFAFVITDALLTLLIYGVNYLGAF